MCIKWFHAASLISVLIGTWFLAFGLKVRPGITSELSKQLEIEKKELICPSDVRQRPGLFWVGLMLITVGSLIELWLMVCT
jgi:hypothetical protein